ncbi:MAG: leukotriene A4 hydrolase C-terminal domain-containing protein [Alphaproteobacteria bacterium]|nr:leukotriene A4 hydrolase C-terminal domain-containing protein [Alphaproteobacteria bacterium]
MRADPHSHADLDQARTRHLALDLTVDFAARRLHGTATLDLDRPARRLDLDCRGLEIASIADGQGRALAFELGPTDAVLGERLRIDLPVPTDRIVVTYRTGPDATGLMWLTPEQTDGGVHPFVLTQCQAIHARSIAPVQDTPRARITYTARITVPEPLSAVMSAAPGTVSRGDGTRTFVFDMPQPIPPYLLALAAGDLVSRDLGPRCRVFAEPGVIDAAAWEFADAEKMLAAAEELFGPYRWERYDFIVLPPSFPLGGMENPRMTFLTPTLLAGDRSLVGVLAHELAHSWTGNLVSNATNEDFWLNEGWTVWAERRILEHLYGTEEAAQQSILGRHELEETLAERTAEGRVTALTYDQRGLDPDVEFSRIPYEKGFLLVTALERAVGRARFDRFVQAYIAHFAFQSIDTNTFTSFVRMELPEAAAVDLEPWLHRNGLPEDAPRFASQRLAAIESRAHRGELPRGEAFSTTETLVWLAHLPPTVDARKVADALGIDGRSNAEVRTAWLTLAIRSGTTGLEDDLRAHLDHVGRTKLLRPVVKAMGARADLKALAIERFEANRERLHSSTRGALEAALA